MEDTERRSHKESLREVVNYKMVDKMKEASKNRSVDAQFSLITSQVIKCKTIYVR